MYSVPHSKLLLLFILRDLLLLRRRLFFQENFMKITSTAAGGNFSENKNVEC